MTKIILILFIFFYSISVASQEDDRKFKLHAADIGVGGFYFKKNSSEGGGISFFASLTSKIDKNLISISLLTGAEIGVIGSSTYNFNDVILQYGRELKIKKWFSFEVFGGIGYYSQQSDTDFVKGGSSISYPLRIDSRFQINDKFGMGLSSIYSINSVNNNFSSNIIFTYRIN